MQSLSELKKSLKVEIKPPGDLEDEINLLLVDSMDTLVDISKFMEGLSESAWMSTPQAWDHLSLSIKIGQLLEEYHKLS
jgi:hypothetical protein